MADLLIADAGPLIALARISRLWLLPRIAARTVITTTVWSECFANPSEIERTQLDLAAEQGWIEQVEPPVTVHDWRLGPGETSAIAWAVEHGAAVLIDERTARRTAARLGLSLIGTVGALVLAKQKGLSPSIREDLQHLAETRYRLSPELLADALALAGESP